MATYLCPECSSEMVLRKNRSSNTQFYGCRRYPRCYGSRDENGVASKVAVSYASVMRMLKAAVLYSEDQVLIFKEEVLTDIDSYELHMEHIQEEGAYTLTVRRKA